MHDAVEGEIAISKQSVNSTEELEGAKLKITDADWQDRCRMGIRENTEDWFSSMLALTP